jgi:O-antigen ligase
MFKAYPLAGTGFGSWEAAITLYDRLDEAQWTPYANNGFLEIIAEGGLAGGLLLFLLVAVTGTAVFKMWRLRRHPEVKIIGLGIITSLFAASILFIFNASLRIPSHFLVFTLLLALGIKIAVHKRRHGIR